MAAQKNGLRIRPCCPGTTINRRLPEYRHVACATEPSAPPELQDRRQQQYLNDSEVLLRINAAVTDLPTYGYRRVWALLRRQLEQNALSVIDAKSVYRVMRMYPLLVERKPAVTREKRAS